MTKTMIFGLKIWLLVALFLGPTFSPVQEAHAETTDDHAPTIVYFYETLCTGCQAVAEAGVITGLEAQGVTIIIKDMIDTASLEDMARYGDFYGVPSRDRTTPLMFAGDQFFSGPNAIIEAYENGTLLSAAEAPLLDVPDDYQGLSGWSGLFSVMVAGLLDSINPCAIAMLLMFVSMVSPIKNQKVLIKVSLSYILGIFVMYFLIGFALLGLMRQFSAQISAVQSILYIAFGLLSLGLAALTLNDFFAARRADYGQIKNQLPNRIKKFNRRFMERFTHVLESDGQDKGWLLTIIPFFIGLVIAVTEAACTGQVYGLILISIRSAQPTTGILYLLLFNLLFVTPLMIISVIAVRAKSTAGIAMFVNDHLATIKILTAGFFLAMAIYFIINAL